MAENRKGRGLGLYYFSRGQLLFLAAGFTLTSTVVFLLGILIGQRIEERKLVKKEEPLVQIPAQTQARASKSGGPSKDEMTFYDTLGKAPPPQPNIVQTEKKSKGPEKASKPNGKETEAAVNEKKTAPAQPVQEKPNPGKTVPLAEEQEKSSPSKKEGREGTAVGEGRWAVQVNAFPDEERARNLAERLKGKGYDAYVAVTNIKGRTWYRVRVGRFQSLDEARKLQETLKSKENFTKAITASR